VSRVVEPCRWQAGVGAYLPPPLTEPLPAQHGAVRRVQDHTSVPRAGTARGGPLGLHDRVSERDGIYMTSAGRDVLQPKNSL